MQNVLQGIKRAHRESNRPRINQRFDRRGKRYIYAAFYSWELCQSIIEAFKNKNIKDINFNIYAEQKYGPLTTKRRNLAMQKRKSLKENGEIASGYVIFPARLMVNVNGEMENGKKRYALHTDFSKHEIK